MKTAPLFSLCHATARIPGWEDAARAWMENCDVQSRFEYILCTDAGSKTPDLWPTFKHVINHGRKCAVDGWNAAAKASTGKFLITGADTWATEISPVAASVAARNALALGARIHIVRNDLASAIAAGSMSLIVANPPYVPLAQREGLQREVRDFEPHAALFAGRGLRCRVQCAGPGGARAHRGVRSGQRHRGGQHEPDGCEPALRAARPARGLAA